MSIISNDGAWSSDCPILVAFHNSRNEPMQVRCVKDHPPMHGFGRQLAVGDIVEIKGTVCRAGRFQVSVPKECAFYDYEYFEPVEPYSAANDYGLPPYTEEAE